jgi:hypothetical protein
MAQKKYRTRRDNRQVFVYEDIPRYRPIYEAPRKRRPENVQVQVTKVGLAIPWLISSVTRDGRRFNLRVLATSESEAIQQVAQKFPLVTITSVRKDRSAEARRVGGKVRRGIGTAGRVVGTLGRSVERLAKWLDKESDEEKRLAQEESEKPKSERKESLF